MKQSQLYRLKEYVLMITAINSANTFRATNKIYNSKCAKQEQIITNNMHKELETKVSKAYRGFINHDKIVSIIMAILCTAGVILGWSLLSKNSNDNAKSTQIENVQNK